MPIQPILELFQPFSTSLDTRPRELPPLYNWSDIEFSLMEETAYTIFNMKIETVQDFSK